MTISEIKNLSFEKAPFFFSPATLRFFGQTVSRFRVKKMPDGRHRISQKITDSRGSNMGHTIRYFNPVNNELELN
jgi:hypothetical protein